MTHYHLPPGQWFPRALTDDERYALRGSGDVYPNWPQARAHAIAAAELEVTKCRRALDRAKSRLSEVKRLPEEEPQG